MRKCAGCRAGLDYEVHQVPQLSCRLTGYELAQALGLGAHLERRGNQGAIWIGSGRCQQSHFEDSHVVVALPECLERDVIVAGVTGQVHSRDRRGKYEIEVASITVDCLPQVVRSQSAVIRQESKSEPPGILRKALLAELESELSEVLVAGYPEGIFEPNCSMNFTAEITYRGCRPGRSESLSAAREFLMSESIFDCNSSRKDFEGGPRPVVKCPAAGYQGPERSIDQRAQLGRVFGLSCHFPPCVLPGD